MERKRFFCQNSSGKIPLEAGGEPMFYSLKLSYRSYLPFSPYPETFGTIL